MKSHSRSLLTPRVRAGSIGDAWRAGLRLFRASTLAVREQSGRGVAFDISDLFIELTVGFDSSIPSEYPYSALVGDYVEHLLGSQRGKSMVFNRLCAWPTSSGSCDQIAAIVSEMAGNPQTRNAIFTLWRPDLDADNPFPISPVGGRFRVRREMLDLTVISRSMDFWVGAVPEMIALAKLQIHVAKKLGYSPGTLGLLMLSAHIYEDDYVVFVREDK